jgi:1,4-alpha-glucan branching enzyme
MGTTEKGITKTVKTVKTVVFELEEKPGCEVFVAGTFNDWNPNKKKLKPVGNGGLYRASVQLPKGKHEYKFVINGDWRTDPACPHHVSDGHGALNSVIIVEDKTGGRPKKGAGQGAR